MEDTNSFVLKIRIIRIKYENKNENKKYFLPLNDCLSADRVFGKIMGELQSPKPPIAPYMVSSRVNDMDSM